LRFITNHQNAFESLFPINSPKPHKIRKANAYYWNDITRYCDYFIHEDSSVLDIGCGTGELLAEVKGKDKSGIDFSEAMIDLAKSQYPDLDFRVMDASQYST
jgi:ubiquinone/menaquinone biosynthesis C-methylase UbiE